VLTQLAAISMALAVRLVRDRAAEEPPQQEDDCLLTTRQAAEFLAVRPDWLYQHAKNLPFTRRLSRKALRFSRRGLLAWREKRRG